jgi:hypothetical protein
VGARPTEFHLFNLPERSLACAIRDAIERVYSLMQEPFLCGLFAALVLGIGCWRRSCEGTRRSWGGSSYSAMGAGY